VGDLVVGGPFSGTAIFGDQEITASGPGGRYVAKLDPATRRFRWVRPILGTLQRAHTCGLATDDEGNIYVSGSFSGTASLGSITLTAKGETDIFVAKLDPGGTPLWAVSAGGPGSGPLRADDNVNHAYRIAVGRDGQVTAVGSFKGTMSLGTTTLVAKGRIDVFVARLDSAGHFLWAVRAGSDADADETAEGVAVDGAGSSTITGYLGAASPADFGEHTLAGHSMFVARLDSSGRFVWATESAYVSGIVCGHDVALDGSGNAIVALWGNSPGALTLAAKLDPSGKILWTEMALGAGHTRSMTHSLVIGETGHATLCGSFDGTKYVGTRQLTAQGELQDGFVAELDPDGKVVWAAQAGGPGNDWASSLARDRAGNLYIAGTFEKTADFGGTLLTSKGDSDLFIWKIAAAPQ